MKALLNSILHNVLSAQRGGGIYAHILLNTHKEARLLCLHDRRAYSA